MTRMLIAAAVVAAFSSVATAQSVDVTLSEWKLRVAHDTVKAGPVTFRVSNEGAMSHAFRIQGPGVDKGSQTIAARESASLTVTLKAGTYELYCPMSEDSHKKAGMVAKLIVTDADAAQKPER